MTPPAVATIPCVLRNGKWQAALVLGGVFERTYEVEDFVVLMTEVTADVLAHVLADGVEGTRVTMTVVVDTNDVAE